MSKFPPPSVPFIEARNKGGKQIPTLVVMHSTVSASTKGSAKAIADMWHGPNSPVSSAHYVVDAVETYQCVGDHTVAYHCGFNEGSIAVEMCDNPSDPESRWENAAHLAMRANTEDLVADLCLAYSIPARYLSDDELRRWGSNKTVSNGGIVTHAQMSRVFKRSSHWDPGSWPYHLFLANVKGKIELKSSKPRRSRGFKVEAALKLLKSSKGTGKRREQLDAAIKATKDIDYIK